jgi:hypothetical protein
VNPTRTDALELTPDATRGRRLARDHSPTCEVQGSVTVNGQGDFGFLLSAVDGEMNGGGGTDKFRIKIWDKLSSAVIYDNQTGAADNADATTAIEAGSIAIHK